MPQHAIPEGTLASQAAPEGTYEPAQHLYANVDSPAMRFLTVLTSLLLLSHECLAQDVSLCGAPPLVANEALRGDIEGKAQLLSRFLGAADLSGKIETSREDIFFRYRDAERTRSNAYFDYQICILIMNDTELTTSQKIALLRQVHLGEPPPSEVGKPLYKTGLDNDAFEGWSPAPGWQHLGRILVNDGTGEGRATYAPFKPELPDYAVEAAIRVIHEGRSFASFGVLVRQSEGGGYAVGLGTTDHNASGICYIGRSWDPTDDNDCAIQGPAFMPDSDWHTYRVEVKGNTIALLVDDAVIVSGSDNRFLSAGRIGLWSNKYQLEVQQLTISSF